MAHSTFAAELRAARFSGLPPSQRRRMLNDAWIQAHKTRCCDRCGATKRLGEWPRSPSGRPAKTCGCYRFKPRRTPGQIAERRRAEHRRLNERRRHRSILQGKNRERIQAIAATKRTNAEINRQLRRLHALTIHDAHVRAMRALPDAEWYRWRYANDPAFAVKERLRRQFRKKAEAVPGLQDVIGRAIATGGSSPTIERVLGYSIAALKQHLERQFVRGMTWDTWGRSGWHIDHILPRKCFDLTTLEGVQAYWSLSNLRPLSQMANLQKRDRVEFLL